MGQTFHCLKREAKMKIIKPVTAATLAFAIGAEQVLGHGDDHVPEEGGAPEPHQVCPSNIVTTTPAPEAMQAYYRDGGWHLP